MAPLQYSAAIVGFMIFGAGVPLVATFYTPEAYRELTSPRVRYYFAVASCVALASLVALALGLIRWQPAAEFAVPLVQLAIVVPAFHAFGRLMGREPRDCVLNWSKGLFWDRVLVMFIWSLVPVPALLIGRYV